MSCWTVYGRCGYAIIHILLHIATVTRGAWNRRSPYTTSRKYFVIRWNCCAVLNIVAQDINGEYGHGVYRLNTDTLMKALDIVNDASWFTESAQIYGVWQVKKCYLHLYEENRLTMDWSHPLKRFGGKTALDVAKEGYACHLSQQGKPQYKVRDYGAYDCRKFGLYYTTVGPDVIKNDFLRILRLV